MRDLNDRHEELLAMFHEYGYCTCCWVNLNEEPHEDKCVSEEAHGHEPSREL